MKVIVVSQSALLTICAGLPLASKSRKGEELGLDALEVLLDLLLGEELPLLGLAAGIADEAGAPADERDGGVAEALQARQGHDRQHGAHVQAGRGRIEADIGRKLFIC